MLLVEVRQAEIALRVDEGKLRHGHIDLRGWHGRLLVGRPRMEARVADAAAVADHHARPVPRSSQQLDIELVVAAHRLAVHHVV